ncbi:MAG: metallophosphoesterase [Candidatus Aenigmatarchaeota archaeon]
MGVKFIKKFKIKLNKRKFVAIFLILFLLFTNFDDIIWSQEIKNLKNSNLNSYLESFLNTTQSILAYCIVPTETTNRVFVLFTNPKKQNIKIIFSDQIDRSTIEILMTSETIEIKKEIISGRESTVLYSTSTYGIIVAKSFVPRSAMLNMQATGSTLDAFKPIRSFEGDLKVYVTTDCQKFVDDLVLSFEIQKLAKGQLLSYSLNDILTTGIKALGFFIFGFISFVSNNEVLNNIFIKSSPKYVIFPDLHFGTQKTVENFVTSFNSLLYNELGFEKKELIHISPDFNNVGNSLIRWFEKYGDKFISRLREKNIRLVFLGDYGDSRLENSQNYPEIKDSYIQSWKEDNINIYKFVYQLKEKGGDNVIVVVGNHDIGLALRAKERIFAGFPLQIESQPETQREFSKFLEEFLNNGIPDKIFSLPFVDYKIDEIKIGDTTEAFRVNIFTHAQNTRLIYYISNRFSELINEGKSVPEAFRIIVDELNNNWPARVKELIKTRATYKNTPGNSYVFDVDPLSHPLERPDSSELKQALNYLSGSISSYEKMHKKKIYINIITGHTPPLKYYGDFIISSDDNKVIMQVLDSHPGRGEAILFQSKYAKFLQTEEIEEHLEIQPLSKFDKDLNPIKNIKNYWKTIKRVYDFSRETLEKIKTLINKKIDTIIDSNTQEAIKQRYVSDLEEIVTIGEIRETLSGVLDIKDSSTTSVRDKASSSVKKAREILSSRKLSPQKIQEMSKILDNLENEIKRSNDVESIQKAVLNTIDDVNDILAKKIIQSNDFLESILKSIQQNSDYLKVAEITLDDLVNDIQAGKISLTIFSTKEKDNNLILGYTMSIKRGSKIFEKFTNNLESGLEEIGISFATTIPKNFQNINEVTNKRFEIAVVDAYLIKEEISISKGITDKLKQHISLNTERILERIKNAISSRLENTDRKRMMEKIQRIGKWVGIIHVGVIGVGTIFSIIDIYTKEQVPGREIIYGLLSISHVALYLTSVGLKLYYLYLAGSFTVAKAVKEIFIRVIDIIIPGPLTINLTSILIWLGIQITLSLIFCYAMTSASGAGDFWSCFVSFLTFSKQCDLKGAKPYIAFYDEDLFPVGEKMYFKENRNIIIYKKPYKFFKIIIEDILMYKTNNCYYTDWTGKSIKNYTLKILSSCEELSQCKNQKIEDTGIEFEFLRPHNKPSYITEASTKKFLCTPFAPKEKCGYQFSETNKYYCLGISIAYEVPVYYIGSRVTHEEYIEIGCIYFLNEQSPLSPSQQQCENLGGKCASLSGIGIDDIDPNQKIVSSDRILCKSNEICITPCGSKYTCSKGYICDQNTGLCIKQETLQSSKTQRSYCQGNKIFKLPVCDGKRCPFNTIPPEKENYFINLMTSDITNQEIPADDLEKLRIMMASYACCDEKSQCVYNGRCYNNGKRLNADVPLVCRNGVWKPEEETCRLESVFKTGSTTNILVFKGSCEDLSSANRIKIRVKCDEINIIEKGENTYQVECITYDK